MGICRRMWCVPLCRPIVMDILIVTWGPRIAPQGEADSYVGATGYGKELWLTENHVSVALAIVCRSLHPAIVIRVDGQGRWQWHGVDQEEDI